MRLRTAKTLGTRHDLNYFRYFTPFRLSRIALGLAVPVLALLWLGIAGKRSFYSKGPLASAHSLFADQCSLCHTSQTAGFFGVSFRRTVTDNACLSCHQAPAHQQNQTFTPACSECHREHRGQVQLDHVHDRQCVQCHADLKTTQGHPRFVTDIRGFNRNHPEFAPVRSGSGNQTAITFSHRVHRSATIRGPRGPVKLQCDDCHRPDAESPGPWPYADPALQGVSVQSPSVQFNAAPPGSGDNMFLDKRRAFMAPVTYEKHCQTCHALRFDDRFSQVIPHKTPDIVHDFVVQQFTSYIAANPGAAREAPSEVRMIPGRTIERLAAPRSSGEWIQQNVDRTEQLLWGVTCRLCHQLEFPSTGGLPRVKPTVMPSRWLPNAEFSHEAHSGVTCESCHISADASDKAKELLIPGIKGCQTCHNGDPSNAGSAENSCFLCHQYHQWNQRKHQHGVHTIQELTGKSPGR